MAFSAVLGELACYKAECGELAGQTEYRCAICGRSVFGPPQLNPALGPPAHSECLLKRQLEDREKEIVALRTQLAAAEKK
jgi:DNA-directed RNA polymerase subunit RPC12/RpoP